VTCTLGNLPVGSTAVITINVTATTFSAASLSTNTATITSSTAASTSNIPSYPFTVSSISTIQASTAVDLSSFQAFSQSDGSVILEWRTHEESRNLASMSIARMLPAALASILLSSPALLCFCVVPGHSMPPRFIAGLIRIPSAMPRTGLKTWISMARAALMAPLTSSRLPPKSPPRWPLRVLGPAQQPARPRPSRPPPLILPLLWRFRDPVSLSHRQAFRRSALPIIRPSRFRSLRKVGITSPSLSFLPRVSIATPTHARCIFTPKESNSRFS